MTKAILVNTAADLAGGEDGKGDVIAAAPNADQGWGRAHLGGGIRQHGARLPRPGPSCWARAGSDSRARMTSRTRQAAEGHARVDRRAGCRRRQRRSSTTSTSWSGRRAHLQGQRVRRRPLDHRRRRGPAEQPRERVSAARRPAVLGRGARHHRGGKRCAWGGDATDQDFALVVSNAQAQPSPVLAPEAVGARRSGPGDNDGIARAGRAVRSQRRPRNGGDQNATVVSGSLVRAAA